MSKELEKAMQELFRINSSEEERILAEYHEKYLMEVASARHEGREEGKEEGIREGKIITAKKMLEKGISLDEIAELTELSKEEISKIKETM